MYEVSIEAGANESRYWASLAFTDQKGIRHERQVGKDCISSKRSNLLQAVIDALGEIQNPCTIILYSNSEDLNEPIRNGWVRQWAGREWKNAKGKTVRNAEQWQKIYEAMEKYSIEARYTDGRR